MNLLRCESVVSNDCFIASATYPESNRLRPITVHHLYPSGHGIVPNSSLKDKPLQHKSSIRQQTFRPLVPIIFKRCVSRFLGGGFLVTVITLRRPEFVS